jgi:hypothetical protein
MSTIAPQPPDVYDVLVAQTRELADVRFERDAYKIWWRASLDKIHEQHVEIERNRQTIARLLDERRIAEAA